MSSSRVPVIIKPIVSTSAVSVSTVPMISPSKITAMRSLRVMACGNALTAA